MSYFCQYLSEKFFSQGFIHANKASASYPWIVAIDLSNDDVIFRIFLNTNVIIEKKEKSQSIRVDFSSYQIEEKKKCHHHHHQAD